jgi:hypothetical protein
MHLWLNPEKFFQGNWMEQQEEKDLGFHLVNNACQETKPKESLEDRTGNPIYAVIHEI